MNEFWAAVTGAIVGALAAGGVSWWLQYLQMRNAKDERDRASATSLFFKLLKISNDLQGFHHHLQTSVGEAERQGLESGWRSVRAIGNGPTKIEFTADEKSFLLRLGDQRLLNRALSLDAIHGSTIDYFELYANLRRELTSMFGAKMEGIVGELALTHDEMLRFAPKAAELDDLVAQLVERAESDANSAWGVITEFNGHLSSKFGMNLSLGRAQP